ncbi:linaridin-like RiPP [Streptomyces sp. NBC_00872]|uniref:linaridin-like RiPP n=1 Tax=Streptomyces sp. NBC_00872 TaxID=2903686 RepID=UPI003869D5F5|nr:linaridin-like RiPP [Streptomyces sp. NBC_00872]
MSLIAQFANESLTDITPGMLSETDAAARLDTPADPVMATPTTVLATELFALATGMLAANIANYVDRNNY